ncbi:MAG: GDP-mannose 4,6-dehydratase, partial [Caldilineaceae bacterium]|nr:GDP-mannose 4,6-dehydratase [Caldilineaceae bacterium]
ALRIFNAYGPDQPLPPTHAPVVPQFMQQTIGKGTIIVYGDGRQTRDFVYIDDVVEALISASTAANIDQQTINVGSGQETSMTQLIEAISTTVHARANVLENHDASGGIQHLVADLGKARQLLKYKPQVSLAEGLRKLYHEDPRFSSREQTGRVPIG